MVDCTPSCGCTAYDLEIPVWNKTLTNSRSQAIEVGGADHPCFQFIPPLLSSPECRNCESPEYRDGIGSLWKKFRDIDGASNVYIMYCFVLI